MGKYCPMHGCYDNNGTTSKPFGPDGSHLVKGNELHIARGHQGYLAGLLPYIKTLREIHRESVVAGGWDPRGRRGG